MMNPTQAKFKPPVANAGDNSPVTPGEIAKYILSVGLAVAADATQTFPNTFSDLDVTPAPDGSISIPLDSLQPPLAPGNYVGIVTAVTTGGVSSDPSAPATFSIAIPVVKPNPPTDLTFV